MFEAPLIIGERSVAAAGGATCVRLDPIRGTAATRAAAATPADAEAAASAAAAAFGGWSACPPTQRRALLNRAADLLEQRVAEFTQAMAQETGASVQWAHFNCQLAAGMLREAAAMTTQIGGELIPSDKPGHLAMAVRQPAGVCLGIAPWNAPVILAVRAVAWPLACGNTVVLKSSELCPMTHWLVGDTLRQAGLPAGVVNVISQAPEDAASVVDALIAHPAVRRVNFTGSTRVGRLIAQSCATHLKRAVLELGGKAPMLVLDDADLEAAVAAGAFGAFANQGQICMSTERLVVDARVADDFVAGLVAKARTLQAGIPGTEGCVLGSLIGREAAARVQSLIDDAVRQGATLLCGGQTEGVILQPTVLDHVTPAMRIYREESFGPVATVIRVHSDEEAITVANDNEFGLAASVFGRDINRAIAVARRIESGICHINSATVQDEPQMPFGGIKGSGYGRLGGKAGIDEFTELRWLSIQTQAPHYPF